VGYEMLVHKYVGKEPPKGLANLFGGFCFFAEENCPAHNSAARYDHLKKFSCSDFKYVFIR
jgi:hypothetical protein